MILPSLVVVQVFFECFAGLCVNGLVSDIRILFVPRAFVILRSVTFPVTQTHPAEIVLATEALHMIAAAVLLNAYMTLGAVLGVRTDVIGRFAIVGTFGQPFLYHLTISRSMIIHAALETKCRFARATRCFLRANVLTANDYLAIGSWTKSQFRVRFDIVLKSKLLIFDTKLRPLQ